MLTLKELEGFSVEEIGEMMQLRENTVKVRLFRARRRLLEAYQRVVRPKDR
ncbi:MAG: sigma factor-like helix-turn-helix DNA-binding protein [Terriglobia bacterium]